MKCSTLIEKAHVACADAEVYAFSGGRYVRVDSVETSSLDPAIGRPTSVLIKGEEFISVQEVETLMRGMLALGKAMADPEASELDGMSAMHESFASDDAARIFGRWVKNDKWIADLRKALRDERP